MVLQLYLYLFGLIALCLAAPTVPSKKYTKMKSVGVLGFHRRIPRKKGGTGNDFSALMARRNDLAIKYANSDADALKNSGYSSIASYNAARKRSPYSFSSVLINLKKRALPTLIPDVDNPNLFTDTSTVYIGSSAQAIASAVDFYNPLTAVPYYNAQTCPAGYDSRKTSTSTIVSSFIGPQNFLQLDGSTHRFTDVKGKVIIEKFSPLPYSILTPTVAIGQFLVVWELDEHLTDVWHERCVAQYSMSPQRYHLYLQHVVPDLYTPFLASVAIGVIGVFYGAAALSYNTVGGLIYPEVTFGGIDSTKHSGPITYFTASQPYRALATHWEIQGDSVIVNNQIMKTTMGYLAFDNNSEHILLPPPLVDQIYTTIQGSYQDPNTLTWLFACDSLDPTPQISFTFPGSNKLFTLYGDDFNAGPSDFNPGLCVGSIQYIVPGSNYGTVGLPFFTSFYTVFVYNSSPRLFTAAYIGFAKATRA